jgi:hypothetical protein
VSLPALEQIHLSSTRRLNGAALDRIIGRKRGGSTSLQICPTITSCHVCSARHDDTNWPRRLLSCCETPGTSNRVGREALKQLLDKLLSLPQRLPAE